MPQIYISFEAFSDELQKFAQGEVPARAPAKLAPKSAPAQAASTTQALTGVGLGAGGLVGEGMARSSLMGSLKKPLTPEELKLLEKTIQSSDAPVTQVKNFPSAAYIPKNKLVAKKVSEQVGTKVQPGQVIYGRKFGRPGIIAHELGHAGIAKHKAGRFLQNIPTSILGRLGSSVPIAGATGAITGMSDDPRVRKWGARAPMMAAAPMLAYEALASIAGARRLRRLGASSAAMRAAYKELVPAWGTYAGRTALAGGASYLGSGMTSSLNEGETQKTGFATSQYSGPLSMGSFRMRSQIPPFTAPPLKTAGPPSEKKKVAYDPSPLGNVDLPGMKKMRTPARGLQQSKAVGTVGATLPDASKALSSKFASRLSKIAKSKGALRAEVESEAEAKARVGWMLGGAGLLGNQAMLGIMRHQLSKPITKEESRLMEKVISGTKVPLHEVKGLDNAAYIGTKAQAEKASKELGIKIKPHSILYDPKFKSPEVLAHELGHAGLAKHRLGKLLQNRVTLRLGNFGTGAGTAALAGALAGLSDDERVRKWGTWAPTIGTIPMLAYEGLASAGGIKRLKRLGASKAALRSAYKQMLPAWGSYLTSVGWGAGASHLGAAASQKGKALLEEAAEESTQKPS